jgi:hypothetical protein
VLAVHRDGEFGALPATVATPLSIALNELLVNAVEHGLAGRDGTVVVRVRRSGSRCASPSSTTGRAAGGPERRRTRTAEDALPCRGAARRGRHWGCTSCAPCRGGARRQLQLRPAALDATRRRRAPAGSAVSCRWPVTDPADGRPAASDTATPPAPWGGRRRGASVQAGPCPRASGRAARLRAVRRFRARRSSSLRPPHTPASWPTRVPIAGTGSATGQRLQTALASSICNSAGPVLPMGKNSSGSSSRQAARWRQSMRLAPRISRLGRGGAPLAVRRCRTPVGWIARRGLSHGWGRRTRARTTNEHPGDANSPRCRHEPSSPRGRAQDLAGFERDRLSPAHSEDGLTGLPVAEPRVDARQAYALSNHSQRTVDRAEPHGGPLAHGVARPPGTPPARRSAT